MPRSFLEILTRPSRHNNRPSTYSPSDYFGEFGALVDAVNNDGNIPVKNNLVAPSVSGTWSPEGAVLVLFCAYQEPTRSP